MRFDRARSKNPIVMPLRDIILHLHTMHRENWLLRSQFDLDFYRLRENKKTLFARSISYRYIYKF